MRMTSKKKEDVVVTNKIKAPFLSMFCYIQGLCVPDSTFFFWYSPVKTPHLEIFFFHEVHMMIRMLIHTMIPMLASNSSSTNKDEIYIENHLGKGQQRDLRESLNDIVIKKSTSLTELGARFLE
ncbi:uncharacterized protein BX664DRAFT_309612 [Halteromyces radiatus]|uniref:uncharacterized protein n=1 Tax=Halteromyces radiatus TaxID=101107 RepID=UPI00221E4F48|nr:uncharacterized protein BX664DRAFT_309612 [Halteromyces radiatus]KAI8098553.1 hypothetical protein BX664DRAFT_309612 [Halteromyces radiatus]